MAHIVWTSDLNTDIPVIDNQHRRIVEYINALYDAQANHSRDEVGAVLDELVEYTLSHFAFEEHLMEWAGYAYIKAHKRVHKVFEVRVGDYKRRFERGEEIEKDLINTLRAWLVNHIKSDDRDYAPDVLNNMQTSETKGGWFKRQIARAFG